MNTDRAAGTFVAVDHRVIRFGTDLAEQMMLRFVVRPPS